MNVVNMLSCSLLILKHYFLRQRIKNYFTYLNLIFYPGTTLIPHGTFYRKTKWALYYLLLLKYQSIYIEIWEIKFPKKKLKNKSQFKIYRQDSLHFISHSCLIQMIGRTPDHDLP